MYKKTMGIAALSQPWALPAEKDPVPKWMELRVDCGCFSWVIDSVKIAEGYVENARAGRRF